VFLLPRFEMFGHQPPSARTLAAAVKEAERRHANGLELEDTGTSPDVESG